MDSFSNFAKSTLASGITSGATSLSVQSGHGSRFPSAPFNAVIWNATDYADPADAYWAGAAEIVRVTAKATDTFTITRAQEGTTALNHNTAGKTYGIVATLTAKSIFNPATTMQVMEDFIGGLNPGSANSGAVGENGWNWVSDVAGFAGNTNSSVQDHPGVMLLQCSGGASSARGHLSLGNELGSITPVVPASGDTITLIASLKLNQTTNGKVRFGLSSDVTNANGGNEGIFWEIDVAANANWRAAARTGGVTTYGGTTQVPSTNYVQLKIVITNTQAEFYYNGTLITTISTGLPSNQSMQFYFQLGNTDTIQSDLYIDYAYIKYEGLSR